MQVPGCEPEPHGTSAGLPRTLRLPAAQPLAQSERRQRKHHHHAGQPVPADRHARLRDVLRLLAVLLSIVGLLLTSSVLNLVSPVQAADGDGDGPQKAVVVAGPVHSQTDKYKRYCKEIANAAEVPIRAGISP